MPSLGISIAIELVALCMIQITSLACLVNIMLIAMTIVTMKQIDEERPTLKKAKEVPQGSKEVVLHVQHKESSQKTAPHKEREPKVPFLYALNCL